MLLAGEAPSSPCSAASPESLDRFAATFVDRVCVDLRLLDVDLSAGVPPRLPDGAGEEAAKWSSPSCARRAAFSAMMRCRSCSLWDSRQLVSGQGKMEKTGDADYEFSSAMAVDQWR